MNFLRTKVGDKLHVKLALTRYNIIDVTMRATQVTETEVVGECEDIEDMKEQYFHFDRLTGIVTVKPKRYTNATTAWIQHITTDYASEFR